MPLSWERGEKGSDAVKLGEGRRGGGVNKILKTMQTMTSLQTMA